MSLLNKASLIQIPSGYKDGTLYSAKPTNGDGDFTFSRGSNLAATRVNSEGLIEKGRENLLTYSNTFDQWSDTTIVLTSGQTGYDGSSDAWLMAKNGTNSRIFLGVTTSGVTTTSVYAKANESNYLRMRCDTTSATSNTFFDLSNGTIYSTSQTIDEKIEDVGGGWYRCSVVPNDPTTIVRLYPAEAGSTTDVSGSIYIQDAQTESGLVSTDVITTTTTTEQAGILEDMPRLDYSGGATCGHLLLEPQRSNVITQSEYIGAWTESGLTITDNNATSPEGVQNAAKLTLPSGSATKRIALGSMPVTAVARSYSFFVKSDDITAVQLVHSGDLQGYARFDISTGVVGSTGTKTTSDIQDYGNGWYRCIANFDSSNAFGSTIYLYISDSATGGYGGSTSAEGDLFVYGSQYEEGSYPTSYIPTYGSGSSVTRSADNCQVEDESALINSEQGALYFEGIAIDPDSSSVISFSDGTNSNRICLSLPQNASNINAFSSVGGSKINNNILHDPSVNSKYAIVWNGNSFKAFVNGVKKVDNTMAGSFSADTLTDIRFDRGDGGLNFAGFCKSYLSIATALTDQEAIELTTI